MINLFYREKINDKSLFLFKILIGLRLIVILMFLIPMIIGGDDVYSKMSNKEGLIGTTIILFMQILYIIIYNFFIIGYKRISFVFLCIVNASLFLFYSWNDFYFMHVIYWAWDIVLIYFFVFFLSSNRCSVQPSK